MCRCSRPNVNGQPGYSWAGENSIRPVDPPDLEAGDEVLHNEPGRCGGGVDSHSFHFIVVKNGLGRLLLRYRHGGGQGFINIGSSGGNHRRGIREALDAAPNSNTRYWLLQTIFHMVTDERKAARDAEKSVWTKAILQKRYKIRKRNHIRSVEVLPEESPTVVV